MIRFLILLLVLSLADNPIKAQSFVNIAPSMNIEHTVETDLVFGGHGVSFYDFNQDGWDDITFVQENDSAVFYINNQGVFELIPSFVIASGATRQVIWVDFDNDGDLDLFVTSTGGLAQLFENDGNFNFTDITSQAGFSQFNTNNFGASFADYDNDGFLDVYIARYMMSGSDQNPTNINALYKNNGDGTFSDVTQFAGVGDSIQPSFMGAWIDVNRDGFPDLYVINDRSLWGNSLYINNGDGTFLDYTSPSGLSMFGEDPMGAMFADFDNDGDLDILCSNGGYPTKPPRLYINNGDSTFYENAGPLGINVPVQFMCTWGGVWIDIDNDSYQDMYLTTGLLLQASGEVRNYLFHSQEGLSFIDSPQLFDGDHVAASYAVAKGDIDNDGYADMVVQNAKEYKSYIWKNDYGPAIGNNFVKVTLEGTVSNKMAIGSWIEIFIGQKTLTHYTRLGDNFISQDSQHHIFGLGQESIIDSIIVQYPSGIIDRYFNIEVNTHYYLTEGETASAPVVIEGTSSTICQGDTLWIDGGDYPEHLWSNGFQQRHLPVTESGVYSVTITTSQGIQIESNSLTISVINQPLISATISNISCFGEEDGSIQLNIITSATLPEISWSNGENGSLIQNLAVDSYTYFYTDEAGCEATGQYTITTPPEIMVFTNTSFDNTSNTFNLDIIVFGGQAPYNAYLDGNLISLNQVGINQGVYMLTIEDNNGCMNQQEIVFSTLNIQSNWLTNDEFEWYPNPNSNGLFKLKSNTSVDVISVINSVGAQVSFDFESNRVQIEAGSGTYTILYQIEGHKKFQKLIIN